MAKQQKEAISPKDPHEIPVPTDESTASDSIKIADSVVASIVKMACLEVDGVYSVGGNFIEGFWENLGGKKNEKGVIVTLDEAENYVMEVHVEMRFGVELAKTALQVQHNIRHQVARMTMKGVGKVDVIIDGVRVEGKNKKPDSPVEQQWDHPHTD